jgi:hypothetical protein
MIKKKITFIKNNRRVFFSEQMLLEFSNRIGAFATFCILQTLNPDNKTIKSQVTDHVDRDTIARVWLRNCMSHFFTFLLIKYRDAINNVVGQSPYRLQPEKSILSKKKVYPEVEKRERQLYILNQDTIDKMLKEFEKVYPDIYKELVKEFTGVERE